MSHEEKGLPMTTMHHLQASNTRSLSLPSRRSGLFPRDFEVSVHVNSMLVPVAYGICVSVFSPSARPSAGVDPGGSGP